MTKETRSRHRVKSAAPSAHFQRIENKVGPGTPDENFCYMGHEFWVEWKQAVRPKKADTMIKLHFEPTQIPWIKQGLRSGRRIYVGVCIDHDLYFISGRDMETLFKTAVYRKDKVIVSVSPDGLEALHFNLPDHLRTLKPLNWNID